MAVAKCGTVGGPVRILPLAIAALVGGCASIKVQIGVLDPTVVSSLEATDRLSRVMPFLVAESDTALKIIAYDGLGMTIGVETFREGAHRRRSRLS